MTKQRTIVVIGSLRVKGFFLTNLNGGKVDMYFACMMMKIVIRNRLQIKF